MNGQFARTPSDTRKALSCARDKIFQAQGEIICNYKEIGDPTMEALGLALKALRKADDELKKLEEGAE